MVQVGRLRDHSSTRHRTWKKVLGEGEGQVRDWLTLIVPVIQIQLTDMRGYMCRSAEAYGEAVAMAAAGM